MTDFQKMVFGLLGFIVGIPLVFHFSGCDSYDFTKMKFSFAIPPINDQSANIVTKSDPKEDRRLLDKKDHAKVYVENAVQDYYQGSYEDALRRLQRAAECDPGNYEAFRLSGQIMFEQNNYRKAFNSWSHATQLPNNDPKVSGDLETVKRLIRYCRQEIDQLQATVNKHPDDLVAMEKLKELQAKIAE